MTKDRIFPITYEQWDGDMELLQFYDVTFTDNWGPYKPGMKVSVLALLMLEGQWQTYGSTKGAKLVGDTLLEEGTFKAITT